MPARCVLQLSAALDVCSWSGGGAAERVQHDVGGRLFAPARHTYEQTAAAVSVLDRRPEIGDLQRHHLVQRVRDEPPVAMRRIGLEAEDADTASRPNDVREGMQLGLCLLGGEMGEEDAAHLVVSPAARGGASIGRCSETAKMQIVDVDGAQVRRKSGLREPLAPRHRDGAHVDEQLDARGRQRLEKLWNDGAFVSNRGEGMHGVLDVREWDSRMKTRRVRQRKARGFLVAAPGLAIRRRSAEVVDYFRS